MQHCSVCGEMTAKPAVTEGPIRCAACAAVSTRPGTTVLNAASATPTPAQAALPDEELKTGLRRFGSYEILGEINRGSFGVVYKARHQGLDRVVALKVLLAGVHASSEAVTRFQREAKAVARLKHPNIVPIYDIGAQEEHYYFAMEFIEGHALSALITSGGGGIAISKALAVAEALADAMECAHQAGVIHRDIKPSNILMDTQGRPHITDFGLAKQIDLDTKYTHSGTTLGTPAYMPPEQARGETERVDARSDVYAIGTVLYEMLTGRTPFAGRSLLEVVVAVINEPVQPPRQLNPKIHRDVQTIVMKCLEKDPRLRYQSSAELRDDLRRFRSGEIIRAKPAGLGRKTGRFLRRHSLKLAAIGAAILALGLSLRYHEERLRVQEQQTRAEVAEKAKRVAETKLESNRPVWRRDWSFPDERFAPLAPGKNVPDYQKQGEGFAVMLSGAQTLVSPEENRFFGDVDVNLEFTISVARAALPLAAREGDSTMAADSKAAIATQAIRIGLQSLSNGFDGIPYLVEYRSTGTDAAASVRLIGPLNLYAHTSGKERLKMAVKAEKRAPPLTPGKYNLNLHREGMSLTAKLQWPNAGPAVSLQTRDLNLSNWIFKNTQLVIRTPPLGFQILSAFVDRKYNYGGDEERAVSFFQTGEYNVAEAEFKVMSEGADPFKKANGLYYLGLIREVCQPDSDEPMRVLYPDALAALDRGKPVPESAKLAGEVRMRDVINYAKRKDWKALEDELNKGWPGNGKIGEPQVWELQGALEAMMRDADKEAVTGPALNLFKRLYLEPGSARFDEQAVVLGRTFLTQRNYADLLTLHRAYPAEALNPDLLDAVRALATDNQLDKAKELLAYSAPLSRREKDAESLLRANADFAGALMRGRRYGETATLFAAVPQAAVAARICAELDKQFTELDAGMLDSLLSELLPKLAEAAPPDAQKLLTDSVTRLGRAMIGIDRAADLPKLHAILRGKAVADKRLSAVFAEALRKIAAATPAPQPGSSSASQQFNSALALELLAYCNEHVASADPELQRAAQEVARKAAVVDDEGSYLEVLKYRDAYLSADLSNVVLGVLRELEQRRNYEAAIAFYMKARPRFPSSHRAFTEPLAQALENLPAEKRGALLAVADSAISAELSRLNDDSALGRWRLEYGDVQLVMNDWMAARDAYRKVLDPAQHDPELSANVALRLWVLSLAHPEEGGPKDILTAESAQSNAPVDFKLAVSYLADGGKLSTDELDTKIKTLELRTLSDAEWALLKGIRLRRDKDIPAAAKAFNEALMKSGGSREWVFGVASQLYRETLKANETPRIQNP